jgi:serine/threonine protein kinase
MSIQEKIDSLPSCVLKIEEMTYILKRLRQLRKDYYEYSDKHPFKHIPKINKKINKYNFLCYKLLCYFHPRLTPFYVITRFLGCGNFGCVLEIKHFKKNTERALKIVPFLFDDEINSFINEIEIMKYIVQTIQKPYCPKIIPTESKYYYINNEERFGSFCMDKIAYTLYDVLIHRIQQNQTFYFLPNEINDLLTILIDLTFNHKITHNDLRLDNIGFIHDVKNKTNNICLLDFGHAYTLDKYMLVIKTSDKLYHMIKPYINVYKYNFIPEFFNFLIDECDDFFSKHVQNYKKQFHDVKIQLIRLFIEKINTTDVSINKEYAMFLLQLYTFDKNIHIGISNIYEQIENIIHENKYIKKIQEICDEKELDQSINNISINIIRLGLYYDVFVDKM